MGRSHSKPVEPSMEELERIHKERLALLEHQLKNAYEEGQRDGSLAAMADLESTRTEAYVNCGTGWILSLGAMYAYFVRKTATDMAKHEQACDAEIARIRKESESQGTGKEVTVYKAELAKMEEALVAQRTTMEYQQESIRKLTHEQEVSKGVVARAMEEVRQTKSRLSGARTAMFAAQKQRAQSYRYLRYMGLYGGLITSALVSFVIYTAYQQQEYLKRMPIEYRSAAGNALSGSSGHWSPFRGQNGSFPFGGASPASSRASIAPLVVQPGDEDPEERQAREAARERELAEQKHHREEEEKQRAKDAIARKEEQEHRQQEAAAERKALHERRAKEAAARNAEREKKRLEEAEARRVARDERQHVKEKEAAERRKAEEEAALKAEEERKVAEEEARRKQEEEEVRMREVEEELRRQLEEQALREFEENQRRVIEEAEAARLAAEEEERRLLRIAAEKKAAEEKMRAWEEMNAKIEAEYHREIAELAAAAAAEAKKKAQEEFEKELVRRARAAETPEQTARRIEAEVAEVAKRAALEVAASKKAAEESVALKSQMHPPSLAAPAATTQTQAVPEDTVVADDIVLPTHKGEELDVQLVDMETKGEVPDPNGLSAIASETVADTQAAEQL